MTVPILYERDYFNDEIEMHYALLKSAENIGPYLHGHEFYEIVLVLHGQIRHLVNDARSILHAGSLTLIRPKDIHRFYPIANHACHIINLAFMRRTIHDLFNYLGSGFATDALLGSHLPPSIQLASTVKGQIEAKMTQLNSISNAQVAVKRSALRMLLFELATQFASSTVLSGGQQLPPWLQRACDAMREPQNLRLGVPHMTQLAAVSPEHLSRSVRKFLNQTPTEYVNDLRLTYAANLLAHGDMPILDISAEIGIDSVSHFYTLFKARLGQTPRQYRLAHSPMDTAALNA